jgi:hypothetical protein
MQPSNPDVTMAVLGQKLDNLTATVTTALKELAQQVKEHDTALYGEKNTTGIVGQMNALQRQVSQLWAIVVFIGSALGLAALDWVIQRLAAQ